MSARGERKLGKVYRVQTASNFLWLVTLRDSSYGIMLADPSGKTIRRDEFIGTYAVFDTSIRSKVWELVGRVSFNSAADEWPNPTKLNELSDPEGRFVYYEGQIHDAVSDVSRLNVTQIFKPEQFASFIDEFLSKRAQ